MGEGEGVCGVVCEEMGREREGGGVMVKLNEEQCGDGETE